MPHFTSLEELLANNRQWVEAVKQEDPEYFARLSEQQAPSVLWIGCSDSRVPANQLLGLAPGEVFVHRNVGNQACHSDANAMACLEYAVEALQVEHVIVCGHHSCGAVKGALMLSAAQPGLVNMWISGIRDIRNKQLESLKRLENLNAQWDRLAELNVIAQVLNVATSPIVQAAWESGRTLAIHGLIYTLREGVLSPLMPSLTSREDLERVEKLGGTGIEMKNVFDTMSWFHPESHYEGEEVADAQHFCAAHAC